jgi:hypothetical protein
VTEFYKSKAGPVDAAKKDYISCPRKRSLLVSGASKTF